MDRGLGNYYRGNSGNNVRREDRRYDDFYADRDRRGGGGGSFRGNRSGNRGGNRDRGFFGNQGNQNTGQNSVIAALQLQNQNLLSAYIRNQSRGNVFPQQQQQQRKTNYNQGSGFRPGDKRRQESGGPSGFKKSKPSTNNRPSVNSDRRSSSGSSTPRPKKETPKKEEAKEELPDIPDDQVEVPDSLMDNVEKLRQRKDVERNVADEDIDKLLVFSFNGKGYDCLTCGFMLMKDVAFKNHLMSKSHVMNVIDARSEKKYQATRDLLDIDLLPDGWYEKSETAKKVIIKQAKLIMKIDMDKKKRDMENYNREPKNFFSVNMASKKSATMTGDTVRITSIVESTIDVKEFSKDRFFGCEFVKTVSSFQCRLCDIKIHNASEVLAHIDSRVHRNKYQMHLKRFPDYEKKQKEQNKELGAILQEHEGQPVLLSETVVKTTEEDDGQGKTLLEEIDTIMVRVPEILNPPPKEDPKEKEETVEETVDENKAENIETKIEESDSTKEEAANEPMEAETGTTTEENKNKPAGTEQTTDVVENAAEETEPADPANELEEKKELEESVGEKMEEEKKDDTEIVSPQKAETKPKKSILKKGAATRGRGGTARRGTPKRTRGGKTTASPKARAKAVEESTPVAEEATGEMNEVDNDGSFMDGFQVVDEVQED